MAEEHRCQAPRLCVNNCDFFGSTATQNMCSKCYQHLQLKEQQSSSTKLALHQNLAPPSSSSLSSSQSPSVSSPAVEFPNPEENHAAAEDGIKEVRVTMGVQQPNRCLTCRKRVGLTGFNCRCGMTFCGTHRYPELHGCTFDFKAMGKDQIAKANPVVKAEKLNKI
ncbi:zf-AN1 domain-containing protein/zf-A20 domain-containing protein [Cephalotus follicularis]|uniref:Zf-AN1 domain-containing protein/zf-A20 domain-containing protein n=1 Tax=Cephalotus follicularis TaxID=3775 RepID=A0A1Q3C9E4_CEPFO|nr:zf-AN1 domain-containing protein/zf-A20 domain-containing protein [Cephalotus follicularis]